MFNNEDAEWMKGILNDACDMAKSHALSMATEQCDGDMTRDMERRDEIILYMAPLYIAAVHANLVGMPDDVRDSLRGIVAEHVSNSMSGKSKSERKRHKLMKKGEEGVTADIVSLFGDNPKVH